MYGFVGGRAAVPQNADWSARDFATISAGWNRKVGPQNSVRTLGSRMSRFDIFWIVLAIISVMFVGAGLVNQREFQAAAIDASEKQIKMAFAKRGERLNELGKPDYSLGRVEMLAKTSEAEYDVTLLVTTPVWISLTALNFFVAPTVTIDSMEQRR